MVTIVCKCDRCGRIFDIGKYNKVARMRAGKSDVGPPGFPIKDGFELDLCDACFSELKIWTKNKGGK